VQLAQKPAAGLGFHFTPKLLAARADLAGLPWHRATDCQLGKAAAENLQTVSRGMRQRVTRAGGNRDAVYEGVLAYLEEVRGRVAVGARKKDYPFRENSIPAAVQMLCAESRPIRYLLVDHLADIAEPTSTRALAKIALFDLSPKVRAEAVKALRDRPYGEFRPLLLDGLRYPWAPVADHAADALIALQDRGAVPQLKGLARLPDPATPYYDSETGGYVVRELVRLNHLTNCVMCHAPSRDTNDLARAAIPVPGEVLPESFSEQYYDQQGRRGRTLEEVFTFVRADVTFLRQDFSVPQPVANAGPWPAMQRYDYLVRERPVSKEELRISDRQPYGNYPQRQAVLYALQELTKDLNPPSPGESAMQARRR
jgi:hypothetical protein